MTDNPITPPPELIEDWIELAKPLPQRPPNPGELATLAAQWGADMELEACCEWLDEGFGDVGNFPATLRAARRPPPKPPSLKEQALLQLDTLNADLAMHGMGCDLSQIRRALEQLDD